MITEITINCGLLIDVCTRLIDKHNDKAREYIDDEAKYKYHLAKSMHYLQVKLFLWSKIQGLV